MTLAFDLDGTLITCRQKQTAVLMAVLREHKRTADVSKIWDLKRGGYTTYDALIAENISEKDAQDISFKWASVIEQPFWLSFDRLYSDTIKVLNDFQNLCARLVLITARKRKEWVVPQLAALGIASFFDGVIVVSPDNSVIEKSKALEDIKAIAYVGDSERDYNASLASRVYFYGLSTGQRNDQFMRNICIPYSSLNAVFNNFVELQKGGELWVS